MKRSLRLFALLLAVLVLTLLFRQQHEFARAATTPPIGDDLRQAVEQFGEIPILIGLDVPRYERLSAAETFDDARLAALSQEIAATGDGVLNRLEGQRISQIKRYDYFPLLAMVVDKAALQALAADRAVTFIELDVPVPPAMDNTLPLIGANNNHFLNYTGSGWSIAILDTGVQKSHPALLGKVISEACYSSNVPSQGASSLCPGGATSSTATNSGLNCADGITGCDHGTHVAGIAARVAPGAWLIPIQVFTRFTDGSGNTFCMDSNRTSPCTLSYRSDQIAGLNRVWGLHVGNPSINVAAANMSLGSGQYTAPCDALPEFNTLRLAIQQLRDQNVSTVIAAGNSGYRNAMAAPACLTPAISVAASDKSDRVASFSNLSSLTTLIAPGTPILAPVPTSMTPIYQVKGGTSMAAPHVAGAIATLKEARPNATVPQIITALTTSGPNITDQRSGGSVTKRRLNTWNALCALINCDGDDFRTIGANQTLNGAISPAGDVDHYYYFGTVGQRLTLRMNRTSGSHDPYLELLSPSGFRVAFNDNGGGGVNALINGYLLPQNGLYQIRARSVNNATGNYQISASTQAETLNPVPQISYLSPSSAAGTFFGSDFWVAIYGSNFMPESQVRWNGQLRAKFYSSSTLIYIRVLGGDIGWPWPRNAWITVENPTPGGGSVTRAFTINDPFLGESKLLAPESGSSVSAGISQSFAISWTAPVTATTWRDMQYMDMRLRNEVGETAAWVRIVERANDQGGSFYRLLNTAGEMVGEGLPGENRSLVLTDTVTLHLAESQFSGSGLTAIMTPRLTFGPAAVGTYNVEFRVDTKTGVDDEPNVQEDVLGTFAILPAGCEVAVADVTLSGPDSGAVDELLVFTTALLPLDASIPVTYNWTPEPETGQGFPNAAFRFDRAGEYLISVQVENCGAFAGAVQAVQISSGPTPDLTIGKVAPATAVVGQPFTYTLTIANSGATTATNLLVRDVLPAGAAYVSGGTPVGSEVQWQIPALGGYGQQIAVTFVASANSDVVNDDYRVSADGGYSAQGSVPVQTRIVDAQVMLTPVTTATLSYSNGDSTLITIPGGSVFADTRLTYKELGAPEGLKNPFAGRAFALDAYEEESRLSDHRLYETVNITMSYNPDDVAASTSSALTLHYWDGNGWRSDGITCTTDADAREVTCVLATPLLTRYALVEARTTIHLPLVLRNYGRQTPSAEITGITLAGSQYAVAFETYGFTPQLPGRHVHFFFSTVPPEQAGVPGSGPWYVYGGPSPFTGYGPADRPAGAAQLCVLVANPDHSVIQGSGNCYNLP